MKIFVAGATGAIGRQLVPQLVGTGHEVWGMTRSEAKRDLLRSLGARPVVADALDPEAVGQAVAQAEPDVVVHQLTALSDSLDIRHPERTFAVTNRLRTEGTDHLLAAARAAGARRFVAQSFAGWRWAPNGAPPVLSEDDPVDLGIPEPLRSIVVAGLYLERAVTQAEGIEGVVLRYGGFYGPGTSLAPGGEQAEAIRKRQFPIVGDGEGIWSFIHVADAAAATVAAIERGRPGSVYQITDDTPLRVREFLPEIARRLGAKPPRRVPRWVGRLLAGKPVVVMMTEVKGASNAKARRELGWAPRYASIGEGLTAEAA